MLSCGRFALALTCRLDRLRVENSDAHYALGLTGGSEPCTAALTPSPDRVDRPVGAAQLLTPMPTTPLVDPAPDCRGSMDRR